MPLMWAWLASADLGGGGDRRKLTLIEGFPEAVTRVDGRRRQDWGCAPILTRFNLLSSRYCGRAVQPIGH
jgi:hypothetical protein